VKKIRDFEADKASESNARAEYKHYNKVALKYEKELYDLKFLIGNSYLLFSGRYRPE
jgi:hypothetical protein